MFLILMEIVVISLGGSLVNTDKGIDGQFLGKIKEILSENDYKFGIVTGGGTSARKYANEAREKGGNEFEADEAAIKATKENAKEVIKAMGDMAYPEVLETFDEARKVKEKIIVMGGTIPGITTDTDSVLLAECLNSKRLVNISNVNGIYDSDPRKNKDAKKFSEMNYEQLIGLAVESDKRKAGTHFVFDLLACKLIARSKIETHFVTGKNLDDVKNAIKGKKHNGTVVK